MTISSPAEREEDWFERVCWLRAAKNVQLNERLEKLEEVIGETYEGSVFAGCGLQTIRFPSTLKRSMK